MRGENYNIMEKFTGTEQWFREVFDTNYEYLLNYLYYLSGDMQLSEDLIQDVFLCLWDKRGVVDNTTVRAFLFTIARNNFLKSTRRKKYDLKFLSGYEETIDVKSPEYLMELREFDVRLQQAIAALPEKSRVVFLMSRIDDLSYAQIAESLGVSVKAVEKQMTRAIAILREKFGKKL